MGTGRLPRDLAHPEAALARAVETIPGPTALPGGTVWEPKWDGYRGLIVADTDTVTIWSRQGRDLTRYFPDLAAAAAEQLAPGTVLDGEVVCWSAGRLDFTSLQRRLTTSARDLPALCRSSPASYAAFDVLADRFDDVRTLPWRDRRHRLEAAAASWRPPLNLSPVTDDPDEAAQWFDELAVAGVEGLVAKGAGQTYRPGERSWMKVKRRDSLEVIAGAVLGTVAAPRAVVAGLPVDGTLRIVGRTGQLGANASRTLATHLHPAAGPHPWPVEVSATTVAGFGAGRDRVRLTLIEPVVVEVLADTAWSGRSFRHQLRYLRPRPEVDPGSVVVPERLQR